MRLIINADDFGISEVVNSSVLRLHEKGIVSSATIIAKGDFFKEAIDIANNNPNLGIGVHLCLDGNLNIGMDYNTIIQPGSKQFYSYEDILKRRFRFSFDPDEIFREYCLQIELVMDSGIKISHLDHHHHLHLYWPILRQVIKVARKYGIRYIRSQKMLLHKRYNLFNDVYRIIHQIYLKKMLNTQDGCFDPEISVKNGDEFFYRRLERLLTAKNTIPEIIIHPRESDDPETRVFSDDKIADLLKNHEIINYHDLNNFHSGIDALIIPVSYFPKNQIGLLILSLLTEL